eukprot:3161704-Lingulodinium_polyedra.AAC.1
MGPVPANDRIFAFSYSRVSRWLARVSEAFAIPAKLFTTHSFRRGGATDLLPQGLSVETIMERG